MLMAMAISITVCTSAYSQMPYNLYTSATTYMPLTSGTSLNGTHVWDSYSDNYVADMRFVAKIDTAHFETGFLGSENFFVSDSADTSYLSGFYLEDADLIDRGTISGTSASPLRYEVDGTPGSRVFKLEIANAGFHGEYDNYGTQNDYINMQVWVYEGSNIVELHYGPSNISHPDEYFNFMGKPLIGMIDNVSPNGDGVIYVLSGNPTAPGIDSMVLSGGTPSYVGPTLNNFPPSGTVYRFVPKNLSVKDLAFNNMRVYPTSAQNEVMIDNPGNEKTNYNIVSISGSTTNIGGELGRGITQVDVSALPAGVYLIELQNASGRATKKFVKL